MKKLTIGTKEFHLLETSMDTNSARLAEFHKYVVALEWGSTAGDLAKLIYRYEQNFNEDARAECLITLVDMRRTAQNIEQGTSYINYLFALIVLRAEEMHDERVHHYVSENYLDEKITEFETLGLTPRLVTETLANFTAASPESFPLGFLETLERLVRYLHRFALETV